MQHPLVRALSWLVATAALVLSLVAIPSPGSSQSTLVALVHGSNRASSVSIDSIRNIYLGRVTFWPGQVPMRPYSRAAESPAGRAFLRSVLGMTPTRFRRHWQSRQFSGQGVAPPTIAALPALMQRIAQDRGAISYALASEATTPVAGVRVVPIR